MKKTYFLKSKLKLWRVVWNIDWKAKFSDICTEKCGIITFDILWPTSCSLPCFTPSNTVKPLSHPLLPFHWAPAPASLASECRRLMHLPFLFCFSSPPLLSQRPPLPTKNIGNLFSKVAFKSREKVADPLTGSMHE